MGPILVCRVEGPRQQAPSAALPGLLDVRHAGSVEAVPAGLLGLTGAGVTRAGGIHLVLPGLHRLGGAGRAPHVIITPRFAATPLGDRQASTARADGRRGVVGHSIATMPATTIRRIHRAPPAARS